MTEKFRLMEEVLRVSTVVSGARSEDEQTALLAGEIKRLVLEERERCVAVLYRLASNGVYRDSMFTAIRAIERGTN